MNRWSRESDSGQREGIQFEREGKLTPNSVEHNFNSRALFIDDGHYFSIELSPLGKVSYTQRNWDVDVLKRTYARDLHSLARECIG